jgi:hypothetical protein
VDWLGEVFALLLIYSQHAMILFFTMPLLSHRLISLSDESLQKVRIGLRRASIKGNTLHLGEARSFFVSQKGHIVHILKLQTFFLVHLQYLS